MVGSILILFVIKSLKNAKPVNTNYFLKFLYTWAYTSRALQPYAHTNTKYNCFSLSVAKRNNLQAVLFFSSLWFCAINILRWPCSMVHPTLLCWGQLVIPVDLKMNFSCHLKLSFQNNSRKFSSNPPTWRKPTVTDFHRATPCKLSFSQIGEDTIWS